MWIWQYEEIRRAVNDIGLIGNQKKKDEALALLGRYAPEMARMDQQLKTTEKHVSALEKELADKDSTISFYRRQSQDADLEIKDLEDKIFELKYQQKELMGHADISMTADIYGHLDVARKDALARNIAGRIFQ